MRRLLGVLLLAALLSPAALASLRMDLFDMQLVLNEEGAFQVTERITITFLTPHHGIERWIPVSYRVPSTGTNRTIAFDLRAVFLDGVAVSFQPRRSGRNQYLRIGDPDRTITGTHVYEIQYAVRDALLFDEEYIRIYWNVTGNEWSIPIERVTATVQLPRDVDATTVSTTSYAGYFGSTSRAGAAAVDAMGRLTFTAGPFNPGEGLAIDLAIPADSVAIEPPSTASLVLRFLDANKAAVLPILTLIVMFIVWLRIGRDPRRRAIAPAFALPRDMHAGVAGVLIDDRIDIRDVSAMIVGLAVKGHLRIEEDADDGKQQSDRALPHDYRLIRRERSRDDLTDVERLLLEALFEHEESSDAAAGQTLLSSLETRFYKHLPTIKSRLYSSLIDSGYYGRNPERTRGTYMSFGLMVALGGAGVAFGLHSLYFGIMVALSGLIILAFSPIMPRKTQKGVRALEQVLGLSRYIRLAEVDRIEFHNAPEKNPETFERMLPFAIALNLTKVWTDRFEGLLNEPPDWYVSRAPVFRGHMFALSMWHLSAGMDRTLASAPRGSSGGKSAWSGGSFGGGFSGGGFGGGGGGGW